MDKYLIHAQNIGLDAPYFQPGEQKLSLNPARILAGLSLGKARKNLATILDSVSFKLHAGERIGLIGHNGAGKSTLLRVLAGVYPISRGQLDITGSTKGLFHISLGMNMEGTGVENIYLRGMQMGLSMREIRDLVPSVIAFSELDDHIGKPISTYSTGMMLRLAFAISTMIQPEILLLDEWIGAGDTLFKHKAEQRMNELVDTSRAMVLATHNPRLMQRLCTHGLVLLQGTVVYQGPIADALKFYDDDYQGLLVENAVQA